MTISPRLISISMFVVFLVSCDTASSTSYPISITPQFSRPIPAVEGLESSSTITALPASALTPSVTLNITQTALAQDMVSAQFAEQTLVAQYPSICKNLFAPRQFSPNGLWMVEQCYSENDKSPILTLSNQESYELWKLVYRDYISVTDFMPDGGLSVVHWSNDERYVYFNSFVHASGGECFVRGNVADSGLGLFRLDLNIGNITTILPLRDNFGWYGYSFSPTDRRLVYGAYARELKILDLNTGKLININPIIDLSEGGGYLWSPDGLELVYSTVLYNEISQPNAYSLRLIDAQSGSERILLESPEDCFDAKSWTEDNTLIVEKNYGQTLIEFDLNSNKIISETATTP
jgi:WD40 repeat protein